MKVESSLTTTALELLNKINLKLKNFKPDFCFEPKKKILKVAHMNDFIINQDEPIGKFAYINECIKNNYIPEYWIIDNPFVSFNYGSIFLSMEDTSRLTMFNNDHSKIEVTQSNLYKKNSIFISNADKLQQNNDKKYKKYLKTITSQSKGSLTRYSSEIYSGRCSIKKSHIASIIELDPIVEYMAKINQNFSENWKAKIKEADEKSKNCII
jgi:hypothetical protein